MVLVLLMGMKDGETGRWRDGEMGRWVKRDFGVAEQADRFSIQQRHGACGDRFGSCCALSSAL